MNPGCPSGENALFGERAPRFARRLTAPIRDNRSANAAADRAGIHPKPKTKIAGANRPTFYHSEDLIGLQAGQSDIDRSDHFSVGEGLDEPSHRICILA